MWKERLKSNSGYCAVIFVKGLSETMEDSLRMTMSRPRFKPVTSRTQVRCGTAFSSLLDAQSWKYLVYLTTIYLLHLLYSYDCEMTDDLERLFIPGFGHLIVMIV
jgi:hypothetical protein